MRSRNRYLFVSAPRNLRFSNFSKCFYLSNQYGQVGSSETHFWRRNTVMFDVRGDMFMMWMCCGQTWVARMWKVIVPIQTF